MAEQRPPGTVDATRSLSGTPGAGARLKAAREAAGMSLDQVAQQLKLAPRQVRALEEESFSELPGRTFSRGFVRNYARLLKLDANDLLAQLPDSVQMPPLDANLHPTGATIAELPTNGADKPSFARWLIPLLLVACIVTAATYEWYRGGLASPSEPRRSERAAAPALPQVVVSPLPNPIASAGNPPVETTRPAAETAPSGIQGAPDASMAPTAIVPPPAATEGAPLVLTYSGPSWTEIRDRDGQLLISRLVASDSVEAVRGDAPFDVVLGNASVVRLTYRGKAVDLLPYTQQNVARLTLP